jgi:hypothetical protein
VRLALDWDGASEQAPGALALLWGWVGCRAADHLLTQSEVDRLSPSPCGWPAFVNRRSTSSALSRSASHSALVVLSLFAVLAVLVI